MNLEEYNRNMNVITSAIRTKRHNFIRATFGCRRWQSNRIWFGKENQIHRRLLPKNTDKGESRTATTRKVVAHGPMWIYVAIAIGMDKAGTRITFYDCSRSGTYGSENTTESEMIGYVDGRIHEMTALLVRRAHLKTLHLAKYSCEATNICL